MFIDKKDGSSHSAYINLNNRESTPDLKTISPRTLHWVAEVDDLLSFATIYHVLSSQLERDRWWDLETVDFHRYRDPNPVRLHR